MDSGMAAILGASLDFHARAAANSIVLDVATSHTVAAAIEGIEIAGFFEYHTRDVTVERLDLLVKQLADGKLRHDRVIAEGGHGAYVRGAPGFESIGAVVATGPRRNLVRGTRLPVIPGAPLGDNMMTGTAGVLEAIRRKRGSNPRRPFLKSPGIGSDEAMGLAAVHADACPGNEAGALRGQKDHDIRDFLDRSESAQRKLPFHETRDGLRVFPRPPVPASPGKRMDPGATLLTRIP